MSYYLDWNNVIIFGGNSSFVAPCDGVVYMDFNSNGTGDVGWTRFLINGHAKAAGGHVFPIEVAEGTNISLNYDYWSYCTFVPYKKGSNYLRKEVIKVKLLEILIMDG